MRQQINNWRRVGCAAVWVVLIVLLAAGCQATDGATHTVTQDASFYLDGPQQARPPDGMLAAGSRVALVRVAGSYAQVVLPDGRRAYVASELVAEKHAIPRSTNHLKTGSQP